PTLLDLLHIPVPDTAQGRSVVPLLGDPRAAAFASRPVFAELKVAGLEAVGVRYAGYKWVFPRQPGAQVETYDLGADPGEQRDVEAFPGRRLPQSIVERDEAAAGYWCTRAMRVPDALSRYSRIWVRVLLGSPAIRLRGMKLLSFLILNSPASARC